jgi:hypothetical protein
MVNTVWPAAQRLLSRFLAASDDRAVAVNRELDVLAHVREVGEWDDARTSAERLVGWVIDEARAGSASEVVEQGA